jgi:metal-responsive CopG/Arc/MetJ family transcriptional regulator
MKDVAYKRINITLPAETLKRLDKMVPEGKRSAFIDKAVNGYLTQTSKAALRKELKEGYFTHAARDLQIAQAWAVLDDAAWETRNQ